MALFSARFTNQKQFEENLRRRARQLADNRKPLNKALDIARDLILVNTIQRQVETEDVGQAKFKALDSKYAARKSAKFGQRPILVASGEMLKRKWFKKTVTMTIGVLRYLASSKVMIRALTHQEPITSALKRRKWFGFRRGDGKKIRKPFDKHIRISLR